jgi:hypothetical protein
MIQNKTEVLNLKTRKTQVPMGYLTQKMIIITCFSVKDIPTSEIIVIKN